MFHDTPTRQDFATARRRLGLRKWERLCRTVEGVKAYKLHGFPEWSEHGRICREVAYEAASIRGAREGRAVTYFPA